MRTKKTEQRFLKATVSAALVASSLVAVGTPTLAASFTDLSKDNVHYDSIMNLLERNIIKGYEDGTFRANQAVTRGQAAKIIASLLNLNIQQAPNPHFTDVKETSSYYPYIAALVEAGVINGYGDQTFKPSKHITRGQMAKIIARGFELQAKTDLPFTDVPSEHEYSNYISALYAANVTTGKTAETFEMAGAVTRGQLASFVIRAEHATQNQEKIVSGTIDTITKNAIVIDGISYKVTGDTKFLTHLINKEALTGATITIRSQKNKVLAVDALALAEGATLFDGKNAAVAELTVPASFTSLKNVSTERLVYSAGERLTVSSVQAAAFSVENADAANLTFNNSTIDDLTVQTTSLQLKKTGSTIKSVRAAQATTLHLNGDYASFYAPASATFTGTAKIDSLVFTDTPNNIVLPSSISVATVQVNGEHYSWATALETFDIRLEQAVVTPENSNGPTANTPDNNSGSTPSPGNNQEQNPNPGDNSGTTPDPGDNQEQQPNPGDNSGATPDPGNNQGQNPNPGDNSGATPDPGNNQGQNPNPGDNSSSTPDPGDNQEQNPKPGDNSSSTPDPGNNQEQQPNPGDNSSSTPDPGNNQEQQPNPGDNSSSTPDPGDNQEQQPNPGDNSNPTPDPGNNQGQPDPGNNGEQTPPSTKVTATGEVKKDGDILVITTPTENGEQSYTVSDKAIQAVLENNLDAIGTIEFEAKDGEVVAIKAITVADAATFNGTSLQSLATPIQTFTVTASATTAMTSLENISNVNNLVIDADVQNISNIQATNVTINGDSQSISTIVATNVNVLGTTAAISTIKAQSVQISGDVSSVTGVKADSLTIDTASGILNLTNTTANTLTANGSFESIQGAGGDSLTIASTANNVKVSNVSSSNIIIAEASSPFARMFQSRAVANLQAGPLFATNQLGTTTMTITFADGDYAAQELKIKRQDVKVDVQQNAFSRISVENNAVDITASTSVARLFVSNNVSYLNLNANVTTLEMNLGQPLTIHSATKKTIGTLNITTPAGVDTGGWLDFINIDATKIFLATNEIDRTHQIFKQPDTTTPVATFSSVISLDTQAPRFGYHYINADVLDGETLYYVLVPENANLASYLTARHSNAVEYDGSKFMLYADTKQVVVYKENASGLIGVSVPNMPEVKKVAYASSNSTTGEVTYRTAYKDGTAVRDAFKYVLVFQNGTLTYQNFAPPGTFVKKDGFNTIMFQTGLSFTGKRTILLTNHSVTGVSTNVTKDTSEYIAALKKLAQLSVSNGRTNPEYIKPLLEWIVTTSNTTFDSFFLSKYVEALNASPDSYKTVAELEGLIQTVNAENAYDIDATMTKADLDLTGTLSNTFTYSTEGIVANSITDTGKLLFTGVAAGTTTVRVTDSAGKATLVHVEVDSNKKVVKANTKVLAVSATAGTLLEGDSHFRYSTDGSKLMPTQLQAKSAIIQSGITADDEVGTLTRVRLEKPGAAFTLSGEETLTPLIKDTTAFGLNGLTALTANHIGYFMADGQIIMYPRSNGTETMMLADATNKTAVYVSASTGITEEIAQSNTLAIAANLQLQSVAEAQVLPATTAVHLYDDGTNIRVFANAAYKGSYTLKDNAANPNITIFNIEAKNVGGKITVPSITPVTHSIATDNTDATVQNINGSSVRAVGLELFAIGAGTSVVTLSNGKQYEVNVTSSNNQYAMTATEVQTLALPASDLHMTAIQSITSDNSLLASHLVDSKTRAIITLPNDTTTPVTATVTATNNQKAIIHITKTGGNYSHTVDREEVTGATLGLNTLSDATFEVIPVEPTPQVIPSYGVVSGNKLFVYNIEVGKRSLRVTNGTLSTVVNTVVTKNGSRYTSTVTPVTHKITGFTLAAGATTSSDAAHLVGDTLYATGDGLINNKANVEVPLENGSFYVIEVKRDPNTGAFSFAESATVTFTKKFTKAQLGLDTLTTASVEGNDTTTTIHGDEVTIAISKDTEARVRVNGTRGSETTAASYVYINRKDADNIMNATVEKAAAPIDLSAYGYATSPTVTWSRQDVARATISGSLQADIYSLNVGTSALELDAAGKKLFVNVTITGDKLRTVSTNIVEKVLSTADTAATGTIIEGDAVRLSADKKSVYAVKANATAKIRLSNGSVIQYSVEQDANGQYVLSATPLTNSATVAAADLGLTGNLSATGLNGAIASATPFEDTVTVTGIANGQTSMKVTDASGKSVLVNVDVDLAAAAPAQPVRISAPVKEIATTPALVHDADASIVRLDGSTIYALAEGTVPLLVGTEIQEVTVTKAGGQYAISTPTKISDAVYTATDLGFAADTAMSITGASDDFYIGQKNGKIIAYSKLAGTTAGHVEFTVKATDGSGLSTLIRLKDTGTALLESEIAVQDETFNSAANVTIANTAMIRFDKANGKLYPLAQGYTYATVSGRVQAIDITRDTNGYLEAAIRPLSLTSTSAAFTKMTATDETIVEIDGNMLYPKKLGETTVKDGNTIVNVKVSADAEGNVTLMKATVTSQFVSVSDAGLSKFTNAQIIDGNTSAISLSRDENNGLTIYSKDAQIAQIVRVEVTDGTNKAMINVTLDETGAVTSATVPQFKLSDLHVNVATAETVQTLGARGVWNGNEITIYPLATGKTALKFANGLVNVTTTNEGAKLNNPTADILAHNLTGINTITNGLIVNNFYPTATGTALVHAGGKVYSIGVTKPAEHYVLDVSSGVPFTTLDLATAGTYVASKSNLVSTKAVIDEDDTNTLIIYADGTGVSDIAVTSGSNTHIYHTTATSATVSTPDLAKVTLTGDMVGATVLSGTSTQLASNVLYHQSVGTTALKATADGRLINATVARDTNGYLKATPQFVTATLKETATITSSKLAISGTTISALDGVTEEKFYTANYRVVAKTTEVDNKYTLSLDERHMKVFNAADYGFQPSDTIVLKDGGNTNAGVASFEMRGTDIVIYSGDVTASTKITVTNNAAKELTFNVTRNADGTISVTPQASLESLKFADMDLTTATHPISAASFDTALIDVTATATGLNITAKATTGTTFIELKQNGTVVGLVNVKIQEISGNSQVISTPVTYVAAPTLLHATNTARQDSNDSTKYYATSVGQALYKVDEQNAIFVKVAFNVDTKTYTATPTAHTLATVPAASLDLTTPIQSASSASTAVNTVINAAKDTVYLYGVYEGIPDITISDGTNYAKVVANNGSTLQTTIASIAVPDSTLASATWTSPATSVATVRGGKIYTQESGTATLNTTVTDGVTSYDVFMNVAVTRNDNRTFAITPQIVRTDVGAAVEVLSGQSVVAVGQMLYAQKAGISTVKVGNDIRIATVSETIDGLKIELSEPVVQKIFTAAQLGLTPTAYTINTVVGSGVVTAQIVNNELIVYAKNAGQAEIKVNGGDTVMHVLVTEENGALTITETIAETTIAGATAIATATGAANVDAIFRYKDNQIFAKTEGQGVVNVDGNLYNIVATKTNNALKPAASRIEYTFTDATNVTDEAGKDFIKTNGTTIIATGFGTEDITVDNQTYRVTVNTDGSMKVVLLATSTIDLAGILSTVTSINSSLVNTSSDSTVVTVAAKGVAGSEIITVSDGTNTIQLKVTVTQNENSFDVTKLEVVSETYNLGQLGLYANNITKVDGTTAFSSPHALVKVSNGTLTVYPGTTGEVHFIAYDIDGGKRLFKVVSDMTKPEASFSFGALSQQIDYNAFGFEPFLMSGSNNLQVEKEGTGLRLVFHDTAKEIFVVRSASLYKTVIVQATANNTTGKFDLATPVIQDAHVVDGAVSNITGPLKTATHEGKTVIYTDDATATAGSYTANNQIYNVAIGTNYDLTATALEESTNYTSATLVQGTDVVSLLGTKWLAKVAGTGIYKTNTGDYVKVHVTANGSTFEIDEDAPLEKLDLKDKDNAITAASVLAPTTGVYVDGTIVYGETTEKIAVSTISPAGKSLYTAETGAIASLARLEVDALALLGWTDYTSSTLSESSNTVRLEKTTSPAAAKFIPVGIGSEVITFTSPSGLKKEITFTVNDDYTITSASTANVVTYTATAAEDGDFNLFEFVFNINTLAVSNNTAALVEDKKLIFYMDSGVPSTETLTITFAELQAGPQQFKAKLLSLLESDYAILPGENSVIQYVKVIE